MKIKYIASPCLPNDKDKRKNLEVGNFVECWNGTKGLFLGYADDPEYGCEMVLDNDGYQENIHIINLKIIYQQEQENKICVGDFVMVPSMQCTIYKVTEVVENSGDKEKRYMVRTPMKVMEGTKIKDLQFCGNEFRESEVIKIKNW